MKVVGIEREHRLSLGTQSSTDPRVWALKLTRLPFEVISNLITFTLKVCKTSFLLKKTHILIWNYLSTQLGHCKYDTRMHPLVMLSLFLVNEVSNSTLRTLACSWWASLLSHQPLLNFGWIFCKRVWNLWKFESNGHFVISFMDA